MSARRKVLAGAIAAAAVSAVVAVPGAAQAAPARHDAAIAAKNPLMMTLGRMQAGPLMPGGRAKVFTLSVTNTSGKAVEFGSEVGGGAHGAFPVESEVKLAMTPVHAPATTLTFGGQDGGLLGSFYPKGKDFGGTYTLPAHATYTWKVSLSATKAWPVNDDRLMFGFSVGTPGGKNVAAKELDLKVGTARTGGPIVQSLTGGGNTLSAAKPLVLRYTLVNHTGAAVAKPFTPWVLTSQAASVPLTAHLAYDLWKNGRWVSLGTDSGMLPTIPAHWANGASVGYTIRVRVVGWDAGAAATDKLVVEAMYDPFEGAADRTVTVSH